MYLTIGRNADTAKLTRKNRFLIDDPESPSVMAYALTKPLKVGPVYGVNALKGVYKFVIQEVNTTDDDNLDLMIPDYYKHFPRESASGSTDAPTPDVGTDPGAPTDPQTPSDPGGTSTEPDGRGMWL